jgi:hypothetical protein
MVDSVRFFSCVSCVSWFELSRLALEQRNTLNTRNEIGIYRDEREQRRYQNGINFIYMKIRTIVLFALVVTLFPLAVMAQGEPANVTFWKELQKLCGKAYAGTVAAAPADDTTFKDKALVMHVRSCEADRIRIPFVVGDDRSRTWILTRKADRIELRHDHRHADGKPDTVTMYGGWTTSVGMPTRQVFPADQKTVDVIAAAATNVWWIELVPGEHFSYNLRRMGSERFFSIKFDLKTTAKAPEAPWGWND